MKNFKALMVSLVISSLGIQPLPAMETAEKSSPPQEEVSPMPLTTPAPQLTEDEKMNLLQKLTEISQLHKAPLKAATPKQFWLFIGSCLVTAVSGLALPAAIHEKSPFASRLEESGYKFPVIISVSSILTISLIGGGITLSFIKTNLKEKIKLQMKILKENEKYAPYFHSINSIENNTLDMVNQTNGIVQSLLLSKNFFILNNLRKDFFPEERK